MPSSCSTSIRCFSAGAVAGPMVLSDPAISELSSTTVASPVSVAFQVSRYILLPPRHGRNVAPSPSEHPQDNNNLPQRQQSKSVKRKASVLANWTSSTGRTSTTSGVVTRSPPFSLNRSISSITDLDHSTRAESPTLSPSESCSSHANSDYSRSPTLSSRPSSTSPMGNTYFPLHLSASDPLQALFKGPDGRTLFSTSTDGRTTVIRRLYGRSAQTSKQKQDGLILAEIEWTDRVRSSRIRFKGVDLDVRIDEYLKETRGGRLVVVVSSRSHRSSALRLTFSPLSPLPATELPTDAFSTIAASRECSPPPMGGPTNGKRLVPATVRSSLNVQQANVYPVSSRRRTLPRRPPLRSPHRPRRHQSSSHPPPPNSALWYRPSLQRSPEALRCPVYPSRSQRRARKERNRLSGCTLACSTSWTKSSSRGLSWSAIA